MVHRNKKIRFAFFDHRYPCPQGDEGIVAAGHKYLKSSSLQSKCDLFCQKKVQIFLLAQFADGSGIVSTVSGIDQDPSDGASGIASGHKRIYDVFQCARRHRIDPVGTVLRRCRQLDGGPVENSILPVGVEFEDIAIPVENAIFFRRFRSIFLQPFVSFGGGSAACHTDEKGCSQQKKKERFFHFSAKIFPFR